MTVGKTDNGSVSVSPKSASKGDTVTITVTPDKGYVLETLTVLDKNDKEIKLTEKNGKYTFTMPASKVTVKATFMDDNTMLNYFVDVKVGDYFYDAVLCVHVGGSLGGGEGHHLRHGRHTLQPQRRLHPRADRYLPVACSRQS